MTSFCYWDEIIFTCYFMLNKLSVYYLNRLKFVSKQMFLTWLDVSYLYFIKNELLSGCFVQLWTFVIIPNVLYPLRLAFEWLFLLTWNQSKIKMTCILEYYFIYRPSRDLRKHYSYFKQDGFNRLSVSTISARYLWQR